MQNRLPKPDQIVPVYAVIAFMSFAWMIVLSLWKLSAWLYFQTINEILAIQAYLFMQVFFDSLLYLGLLLALCFILPPRYLKDDFAVRGSWIALVVLSSMMIYLNQFLVTKISSPIWTILTVLIALGLAILSGRFKWLANLALQVSDRLIIFLYVLLPLCAISILTVIIRNIS